MPFVSVANKIPLIHFTRNFGGILWTGALQPSRSSKQTTHYQNFFGKGQSVFFFAGRCLYRPNGFALAIGPDPNFERMAAGEATPFDTGMLVAEIALPDPPIPLPDFVKGNSFPLNGWRAKFASFLQQNFRSPEDYWQNRPTTNGPGNIYASGNSNQAFDWRRWTWEIRISQDVEITRILAWSGTDALAQDIFDEFIYGGLFFPKKHRIAVKMRLRESDGRSYGVIMDDWSKGFCL